MKNFLFLLLATIFLASCASKSVIITSKDAAIKKKKYAAVPQKKVLVEDKVIVEKVVVAKEIEKEVALKTAIKTEDLPENIDDEFATNTERTILAADQTEIDYFEDAGYNSNLSEKIVSTAIDNIGSRYRTGGTSKSGFDCSGLMIASFSPFNVKLPRTSNEMSRFGKKINPKKAKKGDLIFFKTLGNRKINHVGLVVEVNEDEIKFVHSSIQRGVIISTTKEGYYKKTFAQVNRVLE